MTKLCFQNRFAKCQQPAGGAQKHFLTRLRHFRQHTPEGTQKHFLDILMGFVKMAPKAGIEHYGLSHIAT